MNHPLAVTFDRAGKQRLTKHLRLNSDEQSLKKLLRYVVQRLLRVFFQKELRGVKDALVDRTTVNLSQEMFLSRRPLYRVLEAASGEKLDGVLEVHPDWAHYLKASSATQPQFINHQHRGNTLLAKSSHACPQPSSILRLYSKGDDVKDKIEHDRLFKELLTQFIYEFIELFLPEVNDGLEPGSLHFLDKEMHTELGLGDKREADLLAKGRVRGQDAFFLLHIEHEAQSRTNLPRRMFRYFSILYERYGDLPIYPVALLSYPSPRKAASTSYKVKCLDKEILSFDYRVIQLNRLHWRDFLKRPNPVAAALMSRMRMAPKERVNVKIACLRLLAYLQLNPVQKRFLSTFVDQYLMLNPEEKVEFSTEIGKIEAKERKTVIELTTSWKEEGREEGIEEGRRDSIYDNLEVRFGRVPESFRAKLGEISGLERLRHLGRLAITVESLDEFAECLEA